MNTLFAAIALMAGAVLLENRWWVAGVTSCLWAALCWMRRHSIDCDQRTRDIARRVVIEFKR